MCQIQFDMAKSWVNSLRSLNTCMKDDVDGWLRWVPLMKTFRRKVQSFWCMWEKSNWLIVLDLQSSQQSDFISTRSLYCVYISKRSELAFCYGYCFPIVYFKKFCKTGFRLFPIYTLLKSMELLPLIAWCVFTQRRSIKNIFFMYQMPLLRQKRERY